MSDVNIDSVLAQMRALKARAGAGPEPAGQAVGTAGGPDFGATFKQALDRVSATQKTAAGLSEAFVQGDPDAKLSEVMLASGRSQVAFRGVTEVRNRMVEAYREIMNMPV